MQVNKEDITKQLYRAYNARGLVTPSGAASLSPVYTIGAGAHPSIATQQQGIISLIITAAAGQTGGIGIIVPQNAGALAVITDAKVIGSGVSAATYEAILDGPVADVDYPPTQVLANVNTQNVVNLNLPFFWGFSTTTTTPGTGRAIGNVGVPVATSDRFVCTPVVLMPGWGLVVRCNSNALTWGLDMRAEVFELSPT